MITLIAGRSRLALDAARGAAITAFTHDGQAMFRPATRAWPQNYDPIETSCFPLIPFSNRVRGGRFEFDGTIVQMPNWQGRDHALHSMGWVMPWTVAERRDDYCLCRYDHDGALEDGQGWPWAFAAEQVLLLKDGQLSLRLSITNRSATPMPAGLGSHPYFPNAAHATITFQADGVWKSTGDLPVAWDALPERWDFCAGRAVAGADVDNCFTGFDGRADIDWRGARYGLSITADRTLGHAVLYAPNGEDYFCFEPVSHMNDALNWAQKIPGTGLRILPPGEILSAETVFTVTD